MRSAPIRRLVPRTLVLLGAAVAAGCASDAELDTFAPQGPVARELHSRGVLPVFWIAAAVFVGIAVAMVWLIWRNRVETYDGDDEWPAQTHGHVPLEVGWTVGFLVTMIAVAGLMLWSLPTVEATEDNAMAVTIDDRSVMWEPTVVVVGNQWWWEFRYYFTDQVDLAWRLVLARLPSAEERQEAMTLLSRLTSSNGSQAPHPAGEGDESKTRQRDALTQLCLTMFNLSEFFYID